MTVQGLLVTDDDRPALVDTAAGTTLTYGQLVGQVSRRADELAHLSGHVAFLGTRPRIASVVDLLALAQAGSIVAILDAASPGPRLAAWSEAYQPGAMIGFDAVPDTINPVRPTSPLPEGVLLPTSGSTGSAKFVRLTTSGLVDNAQRIAEATRIAPTDRALVHLPLHFSYGLSVLTSHLAAGAAAVLSTESALSRTFPEHLARDGVTTLPGVPFSLDLYDRTALFTKDLPQLRAVTTSGGRIGADLLARLRRELEPRGVGLWCMYGQTEASGRITVLPPEDLDEAAGSVGYAIPGTQVAIAEPDGAGIGTVTVSGPGTMLGYATAREELGTATAPVDPLDTGDVGRIDPAGRLWLVGRRQRIAKVYGERVSLDDVEDRLAALGVVAAVSLEDRIGVVVEGAEPASRDLERALGFPPRTVVIMNTGPAPRTASGKIDYARLSRPETRPDPWEQQT